MTNVIDGIFNSVIAGVAGEVEAGVREALEGNVGPDRILAEGLMPAMTEVGARFESSEFYIPEMLAAAHAMKAGLAILRPSLRIEAAQSSGRVVIGTVKGDLHDLGKHLVSMMLEAAGFEIVDLGVDVAPERFAEVARECGAKIVGLSALLTTTMKNMEATIDALEEFGIRGKVKVMVGGAPVTEAFASKIGADGYAADAGAAVRLAKTLVAGEY